VNHHDLKTVLVAFAADRIALLQRHEAGARAVSHYDFNNTYQYIIAREETHLVWLQTALGELETPLPPAGAVLPVPAVPQPSKLGNAAAYREILEDDAAHLRAFIETWREKVDGITHARHRTMLNVILGETREHQRFFEQAASGFEDLLGRRTGGDRVGGVLATRWVE
jgi:bacterioferritin (cytochrome b1)